MTLKGKDLEQMILLGTIEEPEEPNLYESHKNAMKPNMCDSGIQTSTMHFDKIENDP